MFHVPSTCFQDSSLWVLALQGCLSGSELEESQKNHIFLRLSLDSGCLSPPVLL